MPAGRRLPRVSVATLGVAVFASVAVVLVVAYVAGWKLQPIETASMEPAYPAGSLAVVGPIDPSAIEPGMTIVFTDPLSHDRLVAHRAVVLLAATPPAWQTRGDANADPDPFPVQATDVRGRVLWAIPWLGHVVTAVRGPQALVLLVGLPLTLLVATELRAWRRRERVRAQDPV